MSSTESWTAVMPVKALASAKSRMSADERRSGPDPAALALAFFEDALAALDASRRVGEIVVVTSDPLVAAHAGAAGCLVVGDAAHPGINAAAAWGARQRIATGGVVIVVSDLPCLSADSVDSILGIGIEHRTAFVADAEGTGTTMWLAAAGAAITTRFGEGSRAAHVAAGAVDLVVAHADLAPSWIRARRDVDTDADVAVAVDLGMGAHSRAALRAFLDRIVTVVRREGEDVVVVDEDGGAERLPWAAARAAGLLDLRTGQRLVLGPGAPPTMRLP